jgi:hypothetical protein
MHIVVIVVMIVIARWAVMMVCHCLNPDLS